MSDKEKIYSMLFQGGDTLIQWHKENLNPKK